MDAPQTMDAPKSMDTQKMPTVLRLATAQDKQHMQLLDTAEKVIFHGHNVVADKYKDGWVSTLWEQGLPAARRPITTELLGKFMSDYHHSIV